MEDAVTVALIAGMIAGGIAATALILTLVMYVLTVVARWKVFAKAGIDGWKSIIPFYNTYLSYQLAGMNGWWCILIITASGYSTYVNQLEDKPSLAVSLIAIILGIIAIVFEFKRASGTAKAFSKKTGFAIGLFFLQPIFEMILGFGDAKYQDPEIASSASQEE